jgi:hypothetical protein
MDFDEQFDEQGAKQMSDQLETFKDADLDAVNGGYGTVWMACYLTARHILNDMDKATFEALLNHQS